jgi:hypothetical protein
MTQVAKEINKDANNLHITYLASFQKRNTQEFLEHGSEYRQPPEPMPIT